MPNELQLAAGGAYSLLTLKPFTEGSAKFLGLLLKPGAEEAGAWLGDRVRIARQQNVEKVLAKAKAKLNAAGIQPTSVPTKILIPILESCGLEDEEEMIERWANLLATSASGATIPPSYIETLATMSPSEARLLDCLSKEQGDLGGIPGNRGIRVDLLQSRCKLPDIEFRRAILSLFQLGLTRRSYNNNIIPNAVMTTAPETAAKFVGTSDFADDFLAVCSPKQAGQNSP